MSELGTSQRIWLMRAGFVLLALFILFVHLLPLQTKPPVHFAPPDMLMLFAFAWAVRRPELVPSMLLALIFLLADLLLQRPPGLWALMLLLATERLKAQSLSLRDAGFFTECLSVAALIVFVFVGYRVILGVLIVDLPPLGIWIVHMLMTLICYPIAVFVTHWVMRIRKYAPGDLGPGGLSA